MQHLIKVCKAVTTARTAGAYMGVLAVLVMMCVSESAEFTFIAFGPHDFARAVGEPVPVTMSFTALRPALRYTLHIDNGGSQGTFARVSSAMVTLNGIEVAGPSDFSQNVRVIDKPVMLAATNTLTVELRSAPGSGFTLQILGIGRENTPPVLAAIGARTVREGESVQFTVTASDPDGDRVTLSSSPLPPHASFDPATGAFRFQPDFTQAGTVDITFTATDDGSPPLSASETVRITILDVPPPTVVLRSPADGTLTRIPAQTVTDTVSDPEVTIATLHHNGATQAIPVTSGTFNVALTLAEGVNALSVSASNAAGTGTSAEVQVTLDTPPPAVAITVPVPQSLVKTPAVTVTGTIDDATATVTVNGMPATVSTGSFTASGIALREGPNTLVATATDAAGNVGTASVTVTLDTTPPVVTITAPAAGSLVNSSPITVTGTVNDASARVVVNGVVATVSAGTFTATGVPLVEGANPLTATATDPAGNASLPARVTVTLDTTAPSVAITAPTPGSTVTQNPPLIAVSYSDTGSGVQLDSFALTANGHPITADCQRTATSASCTPTAALPEGPTTLVAAIRDVAGNPATSTPVQFTLARPPLAITITTPLEGAVVGTLPIVVQGTVNDPTARVIVQNVIAHLSGTTFEAAGVALSEGPNGLLARTRNDRSDQATATRSVILDTTPPVVTITSPPERALLTTPAVSVVGTVSDATSVTCVVESAAATVDNGSFSGTATLHEGQNVVTVTCQDAAGNGTSRQRTLYLDTTLLTVTSVDPGDGTTDVAPTTVVTVTFSEPVNPASISATALFLRADTAVLPAVLHLSQDGRSAHSRQQRRCQRARLSL